LAAIGRAQLRQPRVNGGIIRRPGVCVLAFQHVVFRIVDDLRPRLRRKRALHGKKHGQAQNTGKLH